MRDVITPVGRLVYGGFKPFPKKDDNGNAVLDNEGKPIMEYSFGIAVAKTDPDFGRFWAECVAEAKESMAAWMNPDGTSKHPAFAWKIQDGDGRDGNGQDVSGKPGYAGHYIIKCASRFPPRAHHEGKFAAHEEIQNPDEVIKKGYYVRAFVRLDGNKVTPQDRNKKPGIFISPSIVSLVAYGEVISSGPDAMAAFANAPAITALPAGASLTPTVGAPPAGAPAPGGMPSPTGAMPAPGGMPTPGAAAMPAPGGMPMPGNAMQAPGAAAMPSPAVGSPVAGNTMPMPGAMPTPAVQPAAQPRLVLIGQAAGSSLEALQSQGWTPEALVQQGYAQWVQ